MGRVEIALSLFPFTNYNSKAKSKGKKPLHQQKTSSNQCMKIPYILLLLRSPAISLGFTILREIFAYMTVFNPTIAVVTVITFPTIAVVTVIFFFYKDLHYIQVI